MSTVPMPPAGYGSAGGKVIADLQVRGGSRFLATASATFVPGEMADQLARLSAGGEGNQRHVTRVMVPVS